MKKALAIGSAGILLLGGTVVGAAVLDDPKTASFCVPGGAAVTVSIDGLPTEIAGYSGDALHNAAVIAQVAEDGGYGRQGQLIGLITAMQESDLGRHPSTATPDQNGDAGVFQQRTLQGWYGNVEEISNITYAARAFYNGVTAESSGDYGSAGGGSGYGHIPGLKDISGWESMSPTRAAQAVQRSAYPDAYAQHLDTAKKLLAGLADADVDLASASDGGGEGGTTQCDDAPVAATGDAAEALDRARELMGTTYVFGGGNKTGPTQGGVDCSGLIMYAYGLDTADIGRTAQAQFDSLASTSVPVDQIQPGDLIFESWGRTGTAGTAGAISHVTMYIGDGKVIEASRSAMEVKISPTRFDAPAFVDVRRIPSSDSQEEAS